MTAKDRFYQETKRRLNLAQTRLDDIERQLESVTIKPFHREQIARYRLYLMGNIGALRSLLTWIAKAN